MSFLSSFGISASALTAQRMRMDIIAQNIANANSTRTENGGTYRRRVAVLSQQNSQESFSSYLSASSQAVGSGVSVSKIVEDKSAFKIVHDPSHPDADPQTGDVKMPNVDIMQEMMDMMAATRAYESNITMLNATKSMALKALELGR
ncbi:MAG: flagellar basal body rod protein FlgC [Hyphomonadaceae bacterium]|nr:flagellar basal body rod protein FlgC [Clostridia bacterium]